MVVICGKDGSSVSGPLIKHLTKSTTTTATTKRRGGGGGGGGILLDQSAHHLQGSYKLFSPIPAQRFTPTFLNKLQKEQI